MRCTTAARHPPLRTKAVEQLGADKLETQLGRGRVNSWWLKRSKVQKRLGVPILGSNAAACCGISFSNQM
jgi:hypothetical protein